MTGDLLAPRAVRPKGLRDRPPIKRPKTDAARTKPTRDPRLRPLAASGR